MNTVDGYAYARSIKSDASDEIINTYLMRPAAGVLVRLLYRTRVRPNHVTLAAIAFGILSAVFYSFGLPLLTSTAGLLLTCKDLLDSADGQLARATQTYSRAGRFLDSLGDILVNFLVFFSITAVLVAQRGTLWMILPGALGFLGITLRVSYHVFYHTSYLHLHDSYSVNRLTEDMREEDYAADRLTFRLHTLFLRLYGWQDRMMEKIDAWCRGGKITSTELLEQWYDDPFGLRVSGLLGLGTELALLTICSLLNNLGLYFVLNLLVMNGVWCGSILYRRRRLARRLAERVG